MSLRIIFFGTPEFAVASLKILVDNGYSPVAVVTAPDKPAGRGLKISVSAVKAFALEAGLKVLQPPKLADPEFISEFKSLKPDLAIVVAFRMIPEAIWSVPPLGTFNLHASLLPQYRGAAPINWAIINGESVTGLTTFMIDKEIDTGRILLREVLPIGDFETAGELHDRMMNAGARLLLDTVRGLENGLLEMVDQNHLIDTIQTIRKAPKLHKEVGLINWKLPVNEVYNLIRGLSPYPGAYSYLYHPGKPGIMAKIFKAVPVIQSHSFSPGHIVTDGKSFLHVYAENGTIDILEIQLSGKKRLNIPDFLNGYAFEKGVFMGFLEGQSL